MSARCTSYRDAPGYGNRREISLRIALAFPTKPPSLEALQARFGMSRASAYRWRKAWIEAMEMGRAP